MCRSGAPGRQRRARLIGALAARILVVAAALVMAAGGGIAARTHAPAEQGIAMVICAEGGARTVVLDREGNPVAPADAEVCVVSCLCCPAAPDITIAPPVHRATNGAGDATRLVPPMPRAALSFERGLVHAPRGPPSEDPE